MKIKDFWSGLGNSFCNAIISAVGSTTFWLAVVAIILAVAGNQTWEAVLAVVGLTGYGANRTIRTLQTAGK